MFVRPLTPGEREALVRGLRARDAVTLRRSQIVLASARGERAPAIARSLGCDDQTVRNVLHAFNVAGPACLRRGSSRPRRRHPAFDAAGVEQLRALLHRSPRTFGRGTSVWTLALAAEVAREQGLTATRVSGETIRATLARRGVGWKRAKRWLVSPDPAYRRKKGPATA
jgi:transposase